MIVLIIISTLGPGKGPYPGETLQITSMNLKNAHQAKKFFHITLAILEFYQL